MLIYDLDLPALEQQLQQWGEPAYRARQVWVGLYRQLYASPSEFTNLSRSLRDRLASEFDFVGIEPVRFLDSSDRHTRKTLFKLPSGNLIEAVLMRYDSRQTLCISSQAGCAMGCVFCATGQMGFARHLTAGEIVEQALFVARELAVHNERLSNIVLMGMGEPFHNYDAVLAAVRRFLDPDGLGIGQRHITVSTVGLVPAIARFAEENLQVRLAISLHAATDEERSALLPINHRYPLNELLAAARSYVSKTNRRLTFEWALIAGENDTPDQAHRLGRLLQGLLCHVNLIPLNPTGDYSGRPPDPDRVNEFVRIVETYGVPATVRVRRGIDIHAGCGQLKTAVLRAEARPK